ncbi:hypothetical protein A2U01_0110215, partial [Trifolium medium]|nr:hypothetical protein [Trifolium medium]
GEDNAVQLSELEPSSMMFIASFLILSSYTAQQLQLPLMADSLHVQLPCM